MVWPSHCPRCGSPAIMPHCRTSPTCTWIVCHGCNTFGTADGQRAAELRKAS